MRGTIVNLFAIIIGGCIGLLLKKGLSQKIEDTLMKMIGVAVIIIGLNGVLTAMFTIDLATGKIKESGSILLLLSLVIGGVIGEIVDIDKRLNDFGGFIDGKTRGSGFAKGFIPGTLVFAIGAMSIIGALNDGLTGDSSILFAKSTIDFITAIILASSLGVGVCFASIPVFLWQGSIALCSVYISPFISADLLASICMVGYTMILCIGFNFVLNAKIRVANLLPTLLVPIAYNIIWNFLPFSI